MRTMTVTMPEPTWWDSQRWSGLGPTAAALTGTPSAAAPCASGLAAATVSQQTVLSFPAPRPLTPFAPVTDLGQRMLALRQRAIDAGMRLLSEQEVIDEVQRRRGETP